jgi:hypothetical protein
MIARSPSLQEGGMSFTVKGKEVNWKWLLKGEGWRWLIEHPSWDWFREEGHWDRIREEDRAFLDQNGFTDLFKEFNVEYINVTEEVWRGNIADPNEVKRAVESRFKPVATEKLYSMMPKRLYDLRGSTLLSLAKLKMYASFCMKNLFGMIPDPLRPWWHGPNHSKIARSIVDVNKVYQSLFNVYGICEAIYSTSIPHPEGEYELTLPHMRYNIVDGLRMVAFGRDLVTLDAILLNLTEGWIYQSVELNQKPIEIAEEEFGAYDREAVRKSKEKVGSWLSQ